MKSAPPPVWLTLDDHGRVIQITPEQAQATLYGAWNHPDYPDNYIPPKETTA